MADPTPSQRTAPEIVGAWARCDWRLAHTPANGLASQCDQRAGHGGPHCIWVHPAAAPAVLSAGEPEPAWTSDQPLRADATDGQMVERASYVWDNRHALVQGRPIEAMIAREFAAACAEAGTIRDGWLCPGCGTTKVWRFHSDAGISELMRDGSMPDCDTEGCVDKMVRADPPPPTTAQHTELRTATDDATAWLRQYFADSCAGKLPHRDCYADADRFYAIASQLEQGAADRTWRESARKCIEAYSQHGAGCAYLVAPRTSLCNCGLHDCVRELSASRPTTQEPE